MMYFTKIVRILTHEKDLSTLKPILENAEFALATNFIMFKGDSNQCLDKG